MKRTHKALLRAKPKNQLQANARGALVAQPRSLAVTKKRKAIGVKDTFLRMLGL